MFDFKSVKNEIIPFMNYSHTFKDTVWGLVENNFPKNYFSASVSIAILKWVSEISLMHCFTKVKVNQKLAVGSRPFLNPQKIACLSKMIF